ncbi:hypothetical protein Pcinc_011610 [Petrolisthes cinctipes]|uniref:Uncharacterized protein n=1 Tax=Petrolisthes cinctipes TaxID=88211 RepID=A0AAE1G0Z2_PETCI|nr:hypothetical protein Pcinc_011610 [Petrolisthes cinctipes]
MPMETGVGGGGREVRGTFQPTTDGPKHQQIHNNRQPPSYPQSPPTTPPQPSTITSNHTTTAIHNHHDSMTYRPTYNQPPYQLVNNPMVPFPNPTPSRAHPVPPNRASHGCPASRMSKTHTSA